MIKITDKVKKYVKSNPTETFQFRVTFDDGDDIISFGLTEDEIEDRIRVYDDFMIRLEKNWNQWCSPEPYQIRELFEELGVYEEDEIDQYDLPELGLWSRSNEYPDPLARVDGYKVTYWDKDGIEWNTEMTA